MRFRALPLILLAPLLMAARPSVPLELPPPMHLPEYTDSIKVSRGILAALAARKWLVEADTGESIRARLSIRRHALVVRIDYSPQQLSYHYVDSVDLGYEVDEGVPLIHPNANKWLQQLGDEVQIHVRRFYFEREPAEVVPLDPATAPPPEAPLPAGPAPDEESKAASESRG